MIQVLPQNTIDKVVNKIKKARTIALFMHNSPDGDCVGTAVAFEAALKKLGKNVDLIIQDRLPYRFSPIIGENRVGKIIMPRGKMYDLSILLDCSSPKMTVPNIRNYSKDLIVLDHHPNQKPYGDIYLYDSVSATGIIAYKIIKKLVKIDEKIANSLYFAIISDTGGFKHENTDSLSLSICSNLIERGANISIINRILDNKSIEYMGLLSVVLKDLNFNKKYKLTTLKITRDQIILAKASDSDASMVIDLIRNVDDADITLLFIEGKHNIRIRARSKESPVNKLLEHFGGGGHEKAAGCAIDSIDLHGVAESVTSYVKDYLDNLKNK